MMTESDEMESRPGACNPIDNVALKKLCCLLRSNADTVLNGQASFTLTTEVLNRLSGDFRRHSITLTENEQRPPSACEINSWRPLRRVMANLKKSDQKKEKEKEEWMSDIQFIKDFMLSTPTLKIIHRHQTLSFPISLVRFGNLSVLEIRKVPVHLIEGLQTIRGTLQSLTIVRSVSNLKGLLESCGGDRSVPLTWAKLKFLSLVFNEIRLLDDSLRLVSHLERLDLSHNQIDDTDKFLENLMDVAVLNLSYNKMTGIPSFSMTTRNSLTGLFVRGNHLDNIRGMASLVSLEVLDISENYLVDHSVLLPLKGLHRLRKLHLDMNPLFYQRRHRKLTVCYLSSRAVCTQFVLDKKRLSGSEIGAYNPNIAVKNSPRLVPVSGVDERAATMSPFYPDVQRPTSSSSGIGTNDNSQDIIATSTPKKGRRKKLKARNTEIRDLETSGDFTSSRDATPGGSPTVRNLEKQMQEKREEALRTQREVENLREVYGSNWLQAIQDRNLFQQPTKLTDPTTESDKTGSGKGMKQKKGKSSMTTPTPDSTGAETHSDNYSSEKDVEIKEIRLETEGETEHEHTRSESLQNPTEDDLYLTDTIIDPVNNPIMAAIAKLASGQIEKEDGKINEMSPSADHITKANDAVFKSSVSVSSTPLENSGEFNIRHDPENVRNDSQSRNSELIAAKKKLDFDSYNSNLNSAIYNNNTTDNSEISANENKIEPSISDKQKVIGVKEDANNLKFSDIGNGRIVDKLEVSENISKSTRKFAVAVEDQVEEREKGKYDGKQQQSVTPKMGRKTVVDFNGDRSTDRSTSEMDSSTDNSLQVLESECESEPIFVTLPEVNDAMIIVTTTNSFIVEKDVRGKVKEKLDIRCLVSMTTKKITLRRQTFLMNTEGPGDRETEDDSGTNPGIKMVLKFSYVRKDRRRRCYQMDVQDAENLQKHLQTFLDAKEEEEKKKKSVIMQCLKCNRSFQKKDVVHRSKALPTSGSTKDLKVLKELMETPTLICPGCGSTILIEVEPTIPSSRMRSAGSTASAASFSQGSYSSNSSSSAAADAWPQPLLHQQHMPSRKPAPMLRNRSFDHFSPQASLAARVARTRNSSQTSADGLPVIRRTNLAAMSSHQSQTTSEGLKEGRVRSNAFTASGQLVKMRQRSSSVTDKDSMLHIEDHFSTTDGDGSNQELAKMTKSLRGDTDPERTLSLSSQATVGNDGTETSGAGNKQEVDSAITENNRRLEQQQQHFQHSSNKMSDSGFESGVYSSSLGRNGVGVCVGEQPEQTNNKMESTEEKSLASHKAEIRTRSVEEEGRSFHRKKNNPEKDSEKIKKLREKSGSDIKVIPAQNRHKNLAAMADLVNSLVTEGQDLEEKELQKQAESESVYSIYSEDGGRKSTISVSELKKFFPIVSSPVHRPSVGSVDSDILQLRNSPSGNSIAVLHNVEENDDDDDSVVMFRDRVRNDGGVGGGSSDENNTANPARFVVGSFENSYEQLSPYALSMRYNEDDFGSEGRGGGGGSGRLEVSSPLSSSICNSMVSSVYENVVAGDKVDGDIDSSDGRISLSGHRTLVAKSSVDSTGSEIVRLKEKGEEEDESEEDEDAPSIYDRSKSLKAIRHKSKSSTYSSKSKTVNRFSVHSDQTGSEEFAVNKEEENKWTPSCSDIVDRVSLGASGTGSQGQGQIVVQSQGGSIVLHPKFDRQSSYSEQLYANPDLLERSYGSPTLGRMIREPTADDLYGVGCNGNGDDYEYDDDDLLDAHMDEDEEERYVDGAETTEVTYRFDRLDHRLTLYLMMTLFENHEEFLCKISSECVGYMMEEPYESLLVMSSYRFYILKVTDTDTSQEPDKWLSCVEVQPIPELRYIDMGLGGQSLRLEFVTDCSSYTLVTRNRNKTVQFIEVLHNHLAHYAVSQGITSNVVVNEDVDQTTLDNLNADVVSKVVPDQPLLLYVMGFIERGHYKKFPVSFVVSPSEVCLVRTNHQWPQPRLQAPITLETTGKQFTVLERQKINNVASLEVCELTLKRIRLELFNETEGVSTIWNITMATKQSTYDFIQAISEPWAKEFGVDMDISYSVLDFGKS